MNPDRSILWFLSSPYTRYERGHHGAFIDVCKLSAKICRYHKIKLFSPIAHCHGMTVHGDLPSVDHEFWKRFNAPFVAVCGGLLVARMAGWDESTGMAGEIADFRASGKPRLDIDPESLAIVATADAA